MNARINYGVWFVLTLAIISWAGAGYLGWITIGGEHARIAAIQASKKAATKQFASSRLND